MASFANKPIDVVIDVRSRLEFWLGHIEGAVCIPVWKVATAVPQRTEIAKDARILVYCASGGRSAAAAEVLRKLGYDRVTDGGAFTEARARFTP